MEWGIFWIYGNFWVWKTLLSTVMMIDKLKNDEIIFTNIKLDKQHIPNPDNYYYFDNFNEFVDIMKFAWYFAQEVIKENELRKKTWRPVISRKYRPKFNVFFDEMGIHANANDFKQIHDEHGKELYQFLLQTRKLFQSIYCIVQKPRLLWNGVRMHVQYWYTYKPLWDSKTLWKHFWAIWCQDLDSETWNVEMKKDIKMDTDGTYFSVDIPQEFVFRSIWFRTKYYKYYDDLFLNKLFEIQFSTNYLSESKLLHNLANKKISNQALLHTRKLYEPLIKDVPIVPLVDNSYLKALKVLIIDCFTYILVLPKRLYSRATRYFKNFLTFLKKPTFFSKTKK